MMKISGEPFDQVARARKSTFHRVSRCKRQPSHQHIEPERQAIAAKRRMQAAFHSAEDPEHATANGLLVLCGLNEGKRRPDRIHPLGYGREVYLWSFVVAILIFAPEIEAKVTELERLVCQSHPEVVTIFVKPQTSAGFKKTERRRYGDGDA
jgi:hypothetical protein